MISQLAKINFPPNQNLASTHAVTVNPGSPADDAGFKNGDIGTNIKILIVCISRKKYRLLNYVL
jgi:hypothetical protein